MKVENKIQNILNAKMIKASKSPQSSLILLLKKDDSNKVIIIYTILLNENLNYIYENNKDF